MVVHELPNESPRCLGAGVIWRGHPYSRGGYLGWGDSRPSSAGDVNRTTGAWPLPVAWASSQCGVWVLRRNVERKHSSGDRGRSRKVSHDLFGDHAVSLRGHLGDKQVTKTGPESKGGGNVTGDTAEERAGWVVHLWPPLARQPVMSHSPSFADEETEAWKAYVRCLTQ